jgi:hypothetical protein
MTICCNDGRSVTPIETLMVVDLRESNLLHFNRQIKSQHQIFMQNLQFKIDLP